ncbi:MAG: glycosyltransferase family 2 protein [Kiritimatiellae bacterium]|nr:glycosyltransferase family 2 protein [Kiritimatiellia bacterium]
METFTSVITLTYNKLEYTRRCLPGLLKTNYRNWEIVVVDNGSTDGTWEWLHEFKRTGSPVPVTLVRNSINIGCSTARNQGITASRGENLVFVDNDVTLRSRDWLAKLGQSLRSRSDIGMVGPKLLYPYPPFSIQCAGVAVSSTGRVQFRGRGEPREHPEFNRETEVQALISACLMVRREILRDIGGFDEAFNPVEYEDIDLCYRVRSRGYRILYVPSVEMYHFESVTTAGTPSLPNTYLIVKHGLLFKQRWRHMFETENGPPDAETRWKHIPPRKLESIGQLPLI